MWLPVFGKGRFVTWFPTFHKRWFRLTLVAIGSVLVVAVGVLALLRCANPEWHKSIYIFQVYTWPRIWPMHRDLDPPRDRYVIHWGAAERAGIRPLDYTGIWVDWHRNAVKSAETSYIDGVVHGKYIQYMDDGTKIAETRYEDGLRHGPELCWFSNGKKKSEATNVHGTLNGRSTRWDREGNITAQGVYRKGRPWDGTFLEAVFEGRGYSYSGDPEKDPHLFINTYRDGKPWDGKFRIWDPVSRKHAVKFFKDGEEISAEADAARNGA